MKYKIEQTGMILEERRSVEGFKLYTPLGNSYTKNEIEMLGLTLEEVKDIPRKLYAVREISTGAISFYNTDIIFCKQYHDSEILRERVPEYDIEYGEEK